MKGCLDGAENLYKKHTSAELALTYAKALTNATISCRNRGRNEEAQRYAKELINFLQDKPQVAEALSIKLH